MTALLKSIVFSALLCAGTAWAQTNATDNPDNPHSTTAKDKPGSDTPNSVSSSQAQGAESANPHSTDYNRAPKPSGDAQSQTQKIDAENPDAVNYKNRSASAGSDMDHDQMAMDHDMMKNATPQMMMQKLHMANQEEIKMGKLAQQNGTDRIKSYAQTLVQDHQAADDQVKQLAQQKHVTLSDTPKNPKMQEHEKKMTDRLNSLKGAQFDRAFVDMMSGAHKHLIQMAQGWQSSVQDPDVKNLLGQMMPKLQQHAQMADQLKTPAAQGRAPENR